jgi:hypothetical protein
MYVQYILFCRHGRILEPFKIVLFLRELTNGTLQITRILRTLYDYNIDGKMYRKTVCFAPYVILNQF